MNINVGDPGSQGEQGDDGGGERAGGGGGARTHLPRAMDTGTAVGLITYSNTINTYLPFFYMCKEKNKSVVLLNFNCIGDYFGGRSLYAYRMYYGKKCIIKYTYVEIPLKNGVIYSAKSQYLITVILNTSQCLIFFVNSVTFRTLYL